MTIREKNSEIKKVKKNEGASNFISIKNISGKPELLKLRIGDLAKRIDQKKRVSKLTSKVALSLSAAEFESVVDVLERLQKTIFIESENRKLKKEINKLDQKLDDKAWNELLAIEWAKEAIPDKGITLEHCKVALRRIGIKTPGKGPPRKRNPGEVLKFHKIAIVRLEEDNQGKELTTEQKEKAVQAVYAYPPFKFPSYNTTRKYLTRHKAENLPWGK